MGVGGFKTVNNKINNAIKLYNMGENTENRTVFLPVEYQFNPSYYFKKQETTVRSHSTLISNFTQTV